VRLPDLVTGGAFAALGIGMAVHSRGFPSDFGLAGPGLFPFLIGCVMAGAGMLIAAGGLRRRADTTVPEGGANDWLRRPPALLALLAVPVGIAFYALAAAPLGAGLAGALLVAAMALAWGRRPLESALLGLGAALVFHLVFAGLLRVPLPRGVFEAVLP
jgi:putative tricarboxylic transport membrane protein